MRTGEGARGRETRVFNSPGEELASYRPCGENTKTTLKYQQLYPPRGGAVKVTGTRRGAIWTWGGHSSSQGGAGLRGAQAKCLPAAERGARHFSILCSMRSLSPHLTTPASSISCLPRIPEDTVVLGSSCWVDILLHSLDLSSQIIHLRGHFGSVSGYCLPLSGASPLTDYGSSLGPFPSEVPQLPPKWVPCSPACPLLETDRVHPFRPGCLLCRTRQYLFLEAVWFGHGQGGG